MEDNKPKLKWNQHPADDDITFLGPLSYRHFKIIGWMLLVAKLIIPPLRLGSQLDPGTAEMLAVPLSIMEFITPLSVFFLLMASLSQLLVAKNYKQQMISNGGAALAIIVVFELLYHRYIVGSVDSFVLDHVQSMAICNSVFSQLNPLGFITFNVFIDLFLCTCVMFFLNYKPKKYFLGDKLKWFRCLAVLPVIYEVVCLWIKLYANIGDFRVPISFFPFLPTKPPMMFFVFCAMIVYMTVLERRFCKDGRTHEEYEQYLTTNRSSWHFAKFAAIACLIAGVLDTIIALTAIIGDLNSAADQLASIPPQTRQIVFTAIINKYINAGFGGASDLMFFAPIMLLFNYKKTYEDTTVEIYIPISAVVLLIFAYLEIGLVAMGALGDFSRKEILPQINAIAEAYEAASNETDEYIASLLDMSSSSQESSSDASSSSSQSATSDASSSSSQSATSDASSSGSQSASSDASSQQEATSQAAA